MNNERSKLLDIGYCGRPHGIKGGFAFVLGNVDSSALEYIKKIYLFPQNDSSSIKKEGEVFEIIKISFGNKVIVYLQGVMDRNTVEAMIPFDIKVLRSSLKDLDESEFYADDFVGWEVYEYSSDRKIGEVTSYYDNGIQTIFVIQGQTQTYDIPFVESFVPVVDEEKQILKIVIPEYINEKDR